MKKTTAVKKLPPVRESAHFVLRNNSLGEIGITERAVAMIVRGSVAAIPGVARLTGNTIVDNLAELVGSKSIKDRSISIKAERGGSGLTVEVAVNIRYGYNLPETASELQNAIASDIFSYTGLAVAHVDVIVRDLEEVEQEPAEEEGDL